MMMGYTTCTDSVIDNGSVVVKAHVRGLIFKMSAFVYNRYNWGAVMLIKFVLSDIIDIGPVALDVSTYS